MSKAKTFEQVDMFQSSLTNKTPESPKVAEQKKQPFIPVQTMALDDRDIKNNFMYMMRILLNSNQKMLASSKGQADYIETLIHEMKIKKGLLDPTLAVRTGAFKSFRKN
ncbi:MAG: hypothetical protein KF798_03085 [Candidatus Paracaedibacteraceae bacterium]|nr:hypothetical protein [Candidatus Paracaedibacteraceae bacterium]